MPPDDAIKAAVVAALARDGWTITHDPLTVVYEDVQVGIDLGAERLLGAEPGAERIAVEVKTLGSGSRVRDFRDARGQFDTYQMMLEDVDPGRTLFLATSEAGYDRVFGLAAVRRLVAKRPLPVVVVRVGTGEVVRWVR